MSAFSFDSPLPFVVKSALCERYHNLRVKICYPCINYLEVHIHEYRSMCKAGARHGE
jgi:hypothetical protein